MISMDQQNIKIQHRMHFKSLDGDCVPFCPPLTLTLVSLWHPSQFGTRLIFGA
uniref:Uncharacterized protein n=1 Tax=Romanomermis culicivorax TaxID=13658 RepID=A0A915IZG9_ROMCU